MVAVLKKKLKPMFAFRHVVMPESKTYCNEQT